MNSTDAAKVTLMPDFTQMLLQKVAQLEEALTQKDKFIHSSRMIVKFREDHIFRLEKKLKEGGALLSNSDSQTVIEQLKDEIKILRDQVQNRSRNSNSLVCCEKPRRPAFIILKTLRN